ncbi:MAG: tetratricopeptide repeat protein [Treponema sp.]|nr:tetratricopeptide repeat protein [Treponema sp.]
MKKTFAFILASFILFATFLSCTTTVSGEFERPAGLDMNGARSIAVLDFTVQDNWNADIWQRRNNYYRKERDKDQIVNYLTRGLESRISKEGYLSIASPVEAEKALRYRTTPPCDAYVSGSITHYEDRIDHRVREDDDGKERVYFIRRVSFTLTYSILDANTGKELGYKRFNASGSSYEAERRRDLPDPISIVRSDLDSSLREMTRYISPYKEREYYSLIKDKKNETLQKAYKLASDGNTEEALKIYSEYYEASGSYKAGYNAAMILQSQGKLDEAKKLLDDVYQRNQDGKIRNALRNLNSELDYADRLKTQKGLRESRARKNSSDTYDTFDSSGTPDKYEESSESIKDAGLITFPTE